MLKFLQILIITIITLALILNGKIEIALLFLMVLALDEICDELKKLRKELTNQTKE